ncbi:nucleotidyltransferase [Sporolactobacillus shoreicorticis]|uniref:tRNA(Met) cytidine acetate ligase n=1 Tax=Sporolactobacillus shoreicorticis TaxID=1923877 RepID=A0ABW5S570_9BACL|nr:nucleotidyltransferase [Sporolactobacillus shoreicorticis]MCO7126286.1 nucleotidyltransferase [Sporolactobacillus shoreicorticis]
MIIAGIVAEYNPFHNGHSYQLEALRKQIHPDAVVVVMSGNFLQRGEPAIVSKWTRTQMALEAGVDLVVELPYVFAVGKADVFARGAVSILDRLGVNRLFFSSECGRIEPFFNSLSLIGHHKADYEAKLTESMAKGISYPNAHAAAYRFIAQNCEKELVDLSLPNNSLGFHYIKALHQLGSKMKPITIKRLQAEHNDQTFDNDAAIASASSIRLHLMSGEQTDSICNKLPGHVAEALVAAKTKIGYAGWERFFPFLKYQLLSSNAARLAQIYEMEEGIEHRLLECIRTASTFDAFIAAVKTKRYTWARLQRLAVHILTDTLKEEAKPLALSSDPGSTRLLGMNGKGQAYLADIRKSAAITVISKIRNHRSLLLNIDLKTAQVYDYLINTDHKPMRYTETSHPPIRYDETNRRLLNE